jgi:hypothetical protein
MFEELRERVYAYFRDSAREFITPSDVDQWLQEGLEDLSSRLPLAQKEKTGTTTGTIPIPADLVDPVTLRVGANYASWTPDATYNAATDGDIGLIARVFNGSFEVSPVSDATAYTLRYWSMSADVSLIRGNLKIRLVNYAVSRGKAKEGEFQASEYFLGLYERGLPSPNDATINQGQLPDGTTFEFGPFDGVDSKAN